ncbi:MAG: response regulator [Planctomycetes bacterium]|nr:response regulator [Planctomycetota bacterium]
MERELRVLIVEDCEDDELLLLRELKRRGFAVCSVRVETREALARALEDAEWDVVISDYIMPRLDGLTALRLVKATHPDLPFLLVSGTIGEEVAVEAMRAGAHDYIMKGNLARLGVAVEREVRERTERRKTQEHLHRAERELRHLQKMETLGQLAGSIAHDFNNLLGIIRGFGDFAFRALEPDHPARADLEEMQKAARQAAGLTSQLLVFSRKQVLNAVLLDLNEVLQGMDRMLRSLVGQKIALSLELYQGLPLVKADRGQFEQVVLNLAVNARDALQLGGKLSFTTAPATLDAAYVSRHVDVVPGEYALLTVSDTGCGMGPEVLARLFEPFFTTKEAGKGTGLGLSTVYGIVKQSGGHITVESERGRGTTFRLYLPRALGGEEEAVAAAAAAHPARGTETVLVVEDEPVLRTLARRILEGAGYSVLGAGNAAEALTASEGHSGPIHLFLVDTVMAGGSDADLVRRVVESRPEARVVFVSGFPAQSVPRPEFLCPGATFLQKPFSAEALLVALRAALDGPGPAAGKAGGPTRPADSAGARGAGGPAA